MKNNKQLYAARRIQKALLKKFVKSYNFIVRMLQRRGLKITSNPLIKPECFNGRRCIFLCSKKIGPGIVGILYCCSSCKGSGEIIKNWKIRKNDIENHPVMCLHEKIWKKGVMRPIILYPMVTTPSDIPFNLDLPTTIEGAIRHYLDIKQGKI